MFATDIDRGLAELRATALSPHEVPRDHLP